VEIVVFGLAISSSWGNGHATLWRGLAQALMDGGDRLVFYERDVPYYAQARDLTELPGGSELVLYDDWDEIGPRWRRDLALADAVIVTSFCPDGISAARAVLDHARGVRVFYDLDTPVTLDRLAAYGHVEYLDPETLACFDLVLSFTGGGARGGG